MIQTSCVCFANRHKFPAAMWAWLQDTILHNEHLLNTLLIITLLYKVFTYCMLWAKSHALFLHQVITPEEIVDPNVDEHSVMTYLSQFPKAKLKPGAPLRPKLNPKKARAYGPGIS